MLVWWQKSRYEINYSNFFRGGWHGVLQWCNVRAHKIIISACTIDFWPTLMYQSISADLRQQCLTSFCTVCGVLFYWKRESTVVSSGVRDVTLVTHICSHSAECFFATFCNQTWYCGAPPWAGMSCEKMGFYLQGHSVGLYNQNMTVSTISFISSKPVSLLQPKLVWWYINTRQGKTPWKDFLAFTQGLRQRRWLGELWTRLLPLLAIPVSKAWVDTSSNQEKVERTLLL